MKSLKTFLIRIAGFLILLIVTAGSISIPPAARHWFGLLTINPITYRLYLSEAESGSRLFILNPKANEIPLDTFFHRNDSVHFSRADFFSTFEGAYDKRSQTIQGYWTDDGHKKHRITFRPVLPDTLTGLHPRNTSVFFRKEPDILDDGIRTGSPSKHKVNEALVDSLMFRIMDETFPNIHSVLIARDNYLAYEEYFYGWKQQGLQVIQSVTKSLTGALTGIALSKGEIKNVNESICAYLPEYRDACNEQNKSITLHQLLSMTTNLEWDELQYNYGDERNSQAVCSKFANPFDCLLSRRKIPGESPVFAYNSLHHLAMNKILRKATGRRNPKELKERLLGPLGIKRVNTWKEEHGVIGDISITPRDMLKFGLLYLNEGKWNDKQVVPASWVSESTSPKIKIGPGEGYGYFFWTKQFTVNGNPVDTFYAWGYGGQYIFVVPEIKLVVVMTASNWVMDEKKYAFKMMEDFILPACLAQQ
jgi:hypothetical protein